MKDKKTKEVKNLEQKNQQTKKEKTSKGIKNVIKVLGFGKKKKFALIVYSVLTLSVSLCSLLYPILERSMYSQIELRQWDSFLRITIVYYIMAFILSVITNIANLVINRATRGVWKSIVVGTIERLFPMALKKLDAENTGKLYNRILEEPSSLSSMYYTIVDKIAIILNRVGYVVLLFVFHWQIALFVTITQLIVYVLQKIRIKMRIRNTKEIKKIKDKRSGIGKEIFSGLRDVKCLDMQDQIKDEFIKTVDKENTTWNKYYWKSHAMNILVTFINNLSIIFMGFICYHYFKQGSLTLSSFIVITSYSLSVRWLVDQILNFVEYLQDNEVIASRVMEVFDETIYPQDKFGSTTLNNVQGKLKIQNLDFSYSDSLELFKDLNIEFEPNKLTAIVGKSGEGKSTISNLLFHLYDWQAGTITLDGVDIRELDRKSLKNNLSVIPQSPYIFNMSLKENLLLVKPTATDEEMYQCLEAAQLKEFVDSLPNGLDTLLGENGVKMSGGQKQRVAIARALLKNSPVIIFDEATSSLDNQSQAGIQKVTERLKGDHTLIVIAHRLSTIKNADKIVVLDKHKVAAVGNHEELMNTCQVYKDLYADEQV